MRKIGNSAICEMFVYFILYYIFIYVLYDHTYFILLVFILYVLFILLHCWL
jgi:hypothetical protein